MPTSVRRIASGALVLALAAGTAVTGSTAAHAQGQNNTAAPGAWQSSINLQNTAGTAATVQIQFFDANGSNIKTYTPSAPVPANGSLEVFVPTQVADLAAGQYSAVVNSDQPVKATINLASTNSASGPWTATGYTGIGASSSGKSLYFPGLYNKYYNFSSEMVIQNADTAAATATATFYKQDGTKIADVSLGQIAPNASKTFPVAAFGSQLPSGNVGVFSAVVTTTGGQNLVGIANIWRPNGTASYNAVIAGSPNLFAPALYNNYYGFASAMTLQAVGGAPAAGTITFSNGTTQAFSLAANASQEFYQPANTQLPSGNAAGVFSAKVTTTTGQVVGISSASVPSGARGDFASYNLAPQAANTVNIPNVFANYYGYFSAVTVQNTTGTASSVTIKYATGQSTTYPLPANGTVNINHVPGGNAGTVLPTRTTTAATLTSTVPIVAVVQHNTDPKVAGYDPKKVPSDYLIALTGTPQ